jgi:RNA polymerase sigma factor (sigma-70 family)
MVDGSIAELYARVGPLVLRRCARMLRDEQEAADVTQWVFLRAIEVGFEHRSDPQSLAWLYRTAVQRCLHLLRASATRSRLAEANAAILLPSLPDGPEQGLLQRETLARVLSKVDERSGEIALATLGLGLSVERAAELYEVSVRTVGRARAAFEEAARRVWEEEAT